MNISVTLRRNSSGRLVPNRPQPETVTEARAYKEDMKSAARAEKFLGRVEGQIQASRALDNEEADLNSASGVVATVEPYPSRNKDDKMVEGRVLRFDPTSEQVESFDREVEGTSVRLLNDGSSESHTFRNRFETRYAAQPLEVHYRQETYLQGDDATHYLMEQSLQATPDGLLLYTYTLDDTTH